MILEAIREAVAEAWEAAATVHRIYCVSLACRRGDQPCSEHETYLDRAAQARKKGLIP